MLPYVAQAPLDQLKLRQFRKIMSFYLPRSFTVAQDPEFQMLLKQYPPEWMVASTRPRCEKKLNVFCEKFGFSSKLPIYPSVRKYPRKVVTFHKPLFPGYLFLNISPIVKQELYQSNFVARIISAKNQELFRKQLNDVLFAIDNGFSIQPAPDVVEGAKVRIKSGPMRGVEGYVQERKGVFQAILRIDFIKEAAMVTLNVDDLELA
jgi:transcription antitermination factor NusG